MLGFNLFFIFLISEIVFPNGVLLSLDTPQMIWYKTQKFVKVMIVIIM